MNGRNCQLHKPGNKLPTIGNGIKNADFVFYVSAMQTERCNKGHTVAYAAHCQQEAALDRYFLMTAWLILLIIFLTLIVFLASGQLLDTQISVQIQFPLNRKTWKHFCLQ